MNSLQIWSGPVASEKTTRALHHVRRLLRLGYNVPYVIRPASSVRAHESEHPGFLVTKNGMKFPSLDLAFASEMLEVTDGWGALWIDEPMLFEDEALVFDYVMDLRQKMPVVISGCSATSEMEVFGHSMPRLLAVADYVEFCRADCDSCGSLGTATRSFFKKGHKKSQIAVGGEESYEPLCPTCWVKAPVISNVA